ncbi:MAG: hypothetical protein IPK78_06460 [Rhodospirillales bacterium]|nr:hypothetical protein [Rhodospirillales bacterium]
MGLSLQDLWEPSPPTTFREYHFPGAATVIVVPNVRQIGISRGAGSRFRMTLSE